MLSVVDRNVVMQHMTACRVYFLTHNCELSLPTATPLREWTVSYLRTIPYILESNPHPFYSFRGLQNQIWIRIACGLDSRSRTGYWKNDRAAVRAVRTIK